MSIQQLDLFASFDAPPVKEKLSEAETMAAEVREPVIIIPIIATEEKAADIFPEEIPADNSLVFVDDKIAIKIKPKVAVQVPKPQTQPIIAPKSTTTIVRPKSKRGRKSYKEIDAELD